MFLIKTRVGASAIHGIGVFAAEPVAAGRTVWRYDPAFDLLIPDGEMALLPEGFRALLDTYAYRSVDVGGGVILPCDHARFLNHSDDPNTGETRFESFASRVIAPGEEITCDYGAFCEGWTGFEVVPHDGTG